MAAHSRSIVTTDSSRLCAVGQTTQRFPSNSRGLAASGPTRSVPAIGWQAMNAPGGSFGSTAAIAAAFTLPTSITSAPGSSTGAISAAAPPRLRTGVASTTSAAPRAASAAEEAARSMIPSACARSSFSRVRLHATTSVIAPATRAPSATEPPICPAPITASRPKGAPVHRRCALIPCLLSRLAGRNRAP
jgi:hypothetical protein